MRVAFAACGIALLALLLLLVAGPAYRLNLLSLPNAFALLRWGAYVGLAGLVAGLVVGALAYRRRRWYDLAIAAVAGIASLVAFAVPYQWQRTARAVPPIHDISTDLEHPPEFTATIVDARGEGANPVEHRREIGDQQRRAYPDVAPATLSAPPDLAFDLALIAAQDMGWDVVTAERAAGRIEATDTTRWFGFKDDVQVRLTSWGAGTRVDVRSVSRVGRSDAGTNARRIRAYLQRLQQADAP